MKGLFIWSHSYCRSTIGFYEGLAKAWNAPLKIVTLFGLQDLRKKTGFSDSEFDNLDISNLKDYEEGFALLKEYKEYNHIFGVYQYGIYKDLITQAKTMSISVGIASEAPCNMLPMPKRILKHLYMKCVLPMKVRNSISAADFIINFSGDDKKPLQDLGWNRSQIIDCGYYLPPIPNSKNVLRDERSWVKFTIMLSGLHEWHRSPMVLLKALKILDQKNLEYECYITQEGPLFNSLKEFAEQNNLKHVHFLGFVPMEKLIELYETCSVYIGVGNWEPWGMRLNDALQCGAPLIVSKGMGGYKLVNDYDSGLVFDRNDSEALADCIEKMIKDKNMYLEKATNAHSAAEDVHPASMAARIAQEISLRFKNW